MFILMQKYGVSPKLMFCRNLEKRSKKSKKSSKFDLKIRATVDLAKAGNVDCHNNVATILRGKWQKECRNKAK